MSKEIWKDILGFESHYMISNIGNVKSLKSYRNGGNGSLMKPVVSPNGYERVCLFLNKKKNYKSIHRLVAEHFIENNNNYNIVDHIDGNKTNNKADNLRWCTHQENITYQNRKAKINNPYKMIGVYYNKKTNRYRSSITYHGKFYYLGVYKTSLEANKAYLAKKADLLTK